MKYLIFFILFICLSIHFSFAQSVDKPKIALVLSGGGAKGFAHIGVLKILEEEGIPIDIIVGTSMGSIVGALYSIGYSAGEIEKMAKTEDWDQLLTNDISRMQLSQNAKNEKQRFIASIPVNDRYKPIVPQGVITGQNILNVFCRLTSSIPKDADFSRFPISYACVSTDLETGDEIVINHGFLPTAMYSSMTIPGVFLPIENNGHFLLDGGLVNNFPTDVAKRMGADIIIGVDIRNDLHASNEIITIEHLMDQLINFYVLGKDSINNSLCDILIRPDITGYNTRSFSSKAVDTLVQRGILSALSKIDEIRNLKSSYNLPPPSYVQQLKFPDSWKIRRLSLSGNYSLNNKFILDNLDLKIPGTCTFEQLKNSITKLYGLGCFKRVYFAFDQDEEGEILNLILEEQASKNINVGMRVNTTDAVSIMLNFTQKDYRRFIGLLSLTADISSNPGFNIQTELSKGKLPVFGLQLEGKYAKYDLFYNRKKSHSSELYYGTATIYTYKSVKNSSAIGLALKEEFYTGDAYTSLADSVLNLSKSQTAITSLFTYFSIDNLDDYYFPSLGTELYAELTLSADEKYKSIYPIVLLKNRNIIPLFGKNCLLFNFYGRAVFSSIHQFRGTLVGGSDYSTYFNYHFPFYGLPPITPSDRYSFIGLAGWRVQISKKHFISLVGNCLIENSEIILFDEYERVLGAGLSYSYRSIFGPLDFTVGYSDRYQKLTFLANAGYWF